MLIKICPVMFELWGKECCVSWTLKKRYRRNQNGGQGYDIAKTCCIYNIEKTVRFELDVFVERDGRVPRCGPRLINFSRRRVNVTLQGITKLYGISRVMTDGDFRRLRGYRCSESRAPRLELDLCCSNGSRELLFFAHGVRVRAAIYICTRCDIRQCWSTMES